MRRSPGLIESNVHRVNCCIRCPNRCPVRTTVLTQLDYAAKDALASVLLFRKAEENGAIKGMSYDDLAVMPQVGVGKGGSSAQARDVPTKLAKSIRVPGTYCTVPGMHARESQRC